MFFVFFHRENVSLRSFRVRHAQFAANTVLFHSGRRPLQQQLPKRPRRRDRSFRPDIQQLEAYFCCDRYARSSFVAFYRPLLFCFAGTIISIAFFNFAGISVTKEMSATTRMVLDSVRTIVIWFFSLLFMDQKFHWLQVRCPIFFCRKQLLGCFCF